MAPSKRPIETIDLTEDDSPFYSSQPYAYASSSQGYAQSSQISPSSRAAKQPRTSAYSRTTSGASQQDPVFIDDEEEDTSATQGFTEQEYSWTLYGGMHAKIVGVRYYDGYATVGEMVVLRREPNNAYDSKLSCMRSQCVDLRLVVQTLTD
jgi:SWI/SNF-related matrix-associated actin-dependent regulator of chromatin subfamily A3